MICKGTTPLLPRWAMCRMIGMPIARDTRKFMGGLVPRTRDVQSRQAALPFCRIAQWKPKNSPELLWKLAGDEAVDEGPGKTGRIIPGRDNDLLTFRLATKDSFERAYTALLLEPGHAAAEIKTLYDKIQAALLVTEVADYQQWAEAVSFPLGDLVLRCQLLASWRPAGQRASRWARHPV